MTLHRITAALAPLLSPVEINRWLDAPHPLLGEAAALRALAAMEGE